MDVIIQMIKPRNIQVMAHTAIVPEAIPVPLIRITTVQIPFTPISKKNFYEKETGR
jgi:hypothetical protein